MAGTASNDTKHVYTIDYAYVAEVDEAQRKMIEASEKVRDAQWEYEMARQRYVRLARG